MSRKEFKYGISRNSILVHGLTNSHNSDERTALLGSVVKIEGTIGNGNIIISFLEATSLTFEDSKYYGKQSDFIAVSEFLWPHLIAIPSPIDRISVATNSELCDHLLKISVNSKIQVLYNKNSYPAIVKYVGPVVAMGTGFFFGLQLMVGQLIFKTK